MSAGPERVVAERFHFRTAIQATPDQIDSHTVLEHTRARDPLSPDYAPRQDDVIVGMTPEQARAKAFALLLSADEADGMDVNRTRTDLLIFALNRGFKPPLAELE